MYYYAPVNIFNIFYFYGKIKEITEKGDDTVLKTGDMIKKIRLLLGMTQNELGKKVHLSDDRIRHYELGDRTPKESKLEEISTALGVNRLALSAPDLESYDGVLHALFYLEDNYGLILEKENEELCLKFKPNNYPLDYLTGSLKQWYAAKERSIPLPDDSEEEIKRKKKEYDLWRYGYPQSEANRRFKSKK